MKQYIIKNIIREEVDFIMKCRNQNISVEDIAFILEIKNFVENRFLNEGKINDVIKMIAEKIKSMISSIKKLNLTVVKWIMTVTAKLPGILGKYIKKMILLLLLSSALLNAGSAIAAMGQNQIESDNAARARQVFNTAFEDDNNDFSRNRNSSQDQEQHQSQNQEQQRSQEQERQSRKGNMSDARFALQHLAGTLMTYAEYGSGSKVDIRGWMIELQHLMRDSNTQQTVDSLIAHSEDAKDLVYDIQRWAADQITDDVEEFENLKDSLTSWSKDVSQKSQPQQHAITIQLLQMGDGVINATDRWKKTVIGTGGYSQITSPDTPLPDYWSK